MIQKKTAPEPQWQTSGKIFGGFRDLTYCNIRTILVEARGVEPLSENPELQVSTRVVSV